MHAWFGASERPRRSLCMFDYEARPPAHAAQRAPPDHQREAVRVERGHQSSVPVAEIGGSTNPPAAGSATRLSPWAASGAADRRSPGGHLTGRPAGERRPRVRRCRAGGRLWSVADARLQREPARGTRLDPATTRSSLWIVGESADGAHTGLTAGAQLGRVRERVLPSPRRPRPAPRRRSTSASRAHRAAQDPTARCPTADALA